MTDIDNGKYYELGKRTFWLLALRRSVAAIVLLIIVILFSIGRSFVAANFNKFANFDEIFNVAISGTITLAIIAEIIGIIIAFLEYGVSKIMLDDTSLRIVRGILSKEEVAIPYRRIQSVEIKQSLLHRLLGVGHVVISTTTDLERPSELESENDEEVVPLMDYDFSRVVADKLTNRAEIERMQVQQDGAMIGKNG